VALLAFGANSLIMRSLVSGLVSPVSSSTLLSLMASLISLKMYRAVSTNCVKMMSFLPPVSRIWSLTICSFSAVIFLSAYGFIRSRLCLRGWRSSRSSLISFFIVCLSYSAVSGMSGVFSRSWKNLSSFCSSSALISVRILWKVLLSRILSWSRVLLK